MSIIPLDQLLREIISGLQELSLVGGTENETPVDSTKFSPEPSESFVEQLAVSPEHQFDFWRSQSVSSGGSKIILLELGPKIMDPTFCDKS